MNHLGRALISTIYGQFDVEGPNGHHKCYVMSPAQSSVATAKFPRYFQLETARVVVAQLVLAVAYVHGQGYAHGGKLWGHILI